MSFESREDQVREYGHAAIEAMEAHNVSLTPANYRVWYTYVAGQDPDLSKMMDLLISNKVVFTPDRNRDIYEKFFDTGSAIGELFTKGAEIEALTAKILDHLSQASADQSTYHENMSVLSDGLSAQTDAVALAEMMKAVLAETKKIITKSQQIKESLDDTSIEMANLKRNLEEAREDAMTDGLTGIGNRKYLDMRLREEVMTAMESGEPLCVILCDIDFFKKFNDTFGHNIGDEVIKLTASVLKDNLKGKDTPARYGGEEFCIVLPQTSLANAEKLANHIRETLANRSLTNKRTGERYGSITVSMGIAALRPGESTGALIERADEALYRAKEGGRNRVECEIVDAPEAAGQQAAPSISAA